jgi:4-amino-4-deoxy-L-arabinose transferase-like glycosyltransferase
MYPYTSLNAYNIWALFGFWEGDTVSHWGLTYQQWGIAAFAALTAFILWQLHRRFDQRSALFAAFLLMFAFFMVMSRMHERYLFPVFALFAMSWYVRGTIWIYLGLAITYLANLAYVMSTLNAGTFIPDGHWSIYVLAPVNILLFGLALWAFYRRQRAGTADSDFQPPPEAPPPLPPPEIPPALPPPSPAEIAQPPELEGLEDGRSPPSHETERPPPAREGVKLWSAQGGVVALTVLFFALATWNLGDLRTPRSNWDLTVTPVEVVVDIGSSAHVDEVFLYMHDTREMEVELYSGSPESWESAGTHTLSEEFRKWRSVPLGRETTHVRLRFSSGYGSIGELALFSEDEPLEISGGVVEGGPQAGALVDEQDAIEDPRSHMSNTHFDEVWYVPTAEQHLRLEEPSQWDHPPASKLIMAASIAVFGENNFGWRIGGVIFATLMIPLVYVFARRLLDSPRAGLIAAALVTFDFMHFAQGRIATPETFILFFVICMFYFFYRYSQDPERGGRYLFLSLLFFGLGFSTKWVTAWGFIGLLLLLLLIKWRTPAKRLDRIVLALVSLGFALVPLLLMPFLPESIRWLAPISVLFGFVPPLLLLAFPQWGQSVHKREVYWFAAGAGAAVAVYLLSYAPYFLADHGLRDFWDLQMRMFDFHSGTEQGHSASSAWYTWPVMLKPVWFHVTYYDDARSYIASMGNPALWWAGIPVMLATLWMAVRRRSRTAAFIVIPFLAQWLMFTAISRITFMYHFYPNVLFMALGAALCAHLLWSRFGWGKWAVGAYLVLNVACFAVFFPLISGMTMSNGYWDALSWMVDWVV